MKYYPEGILYDTAANRAALHSRAALAEAMEKGQILEAKAGLCTESHDLIVRLPGGVRSGGFCAIYRFLQKGETRAETCATIVLDKTPTGRKDEPT